MGDRFEFGSVDQQVRNRGINPRWKLTQDPPVATQSEPCYLPFSVARVTNSNHSATEPVIQYTVLQFQYSYSLLFSLYCNLTHRGRVVRHVLCVDRRQLLVNCGRVCGVRQLSDCHQGCAVTLGPPHGTVIALPMFIAVTVLYYISNEMRQLLCLLYYRGIEVAEQYVLLLGATRGHYTGSDLIMRLLLYLHHMWF